MRRRYSIQNDSRDSSLISDYHVKNGVFADYVRNDFPKGLTTFPTYAQVPASTRVPLKDITLPEIGTIIVKWCTPLHNGWINRSVVEFTTSGNGGGISSRGNQGTQSEMNMLGFDWSGWTIANRPLNPFIDWTKPHITAISYDRNKLPSKSVTDSFLFVGPPNDAVSVYLDGQPYRVSYRTNEFNSAFTGTRFVLGYAQSPLNIYRIMIFDRYLNQNEINNLIL